MHVNNERKCFSDAQKVMWSPDGDQYAVVVNDRVDIYNMESATVIGTIVFPKRISCLKFLNVRILGCSRCMLL